MAGAVPGVEGPGNWLCWVFVAVRRLSPGVASGGYSVVLSGLLIAVASLAVEHRL